MKILIIEDSAPLRKAYARWFTEHEVISLSVVASGMALVLGQGHLRENPPDVILCDNDTGPGPRGIDFAKQLSEAGYQGKFILCSGDIAPPLEKAIEELGYKFISKPAMMKDIAEAVANFNPIE